MRDQDKAEIACQWAEWNSTHFAYVVMQTALPGLAWVVRRDDQPVAAFGFSVASYVDPDLWQAWAFGTKDFKRAVPEMTRFLHEQYSEIKETTSVRRVQAFTLTDHDVSHRWLKSLGAKHEGTLRAYGRGGEDFDVYAWVK